MTGDLAAFRNELRALVLSSADKDEPQGGLADDEILFGPESRLMLDSLDALQISMEIQKRYGIRLPDSKETRRALSSISHLAEYLAMRRP
ncbi:MAG: acyl carrier protein [Gallionellales bacterium RIFCSPLOWO2_02_FULL_57_47]|nr:MAG: acyl carrier protein [Gallionellales bacterium RIFCSPLOWO2_02_FULL_57_47]